MGWLTYYKSPDETPRDNLMRQALQWTSLPEDQRPTFVDHAQRGSTHYFAYRFPAEYAAAHGGTKTYVPGPDGSYVVCFIFLTSSRRDGSCNFGYKDMDESYGPSKADCPVRLLEKLSPLQDPDGYAAQWRARCRANATRPAPAKIATGQTITLAEPVAFRDGTKRQQFRVLDMVPARYGRRAYRVFESLSDGMRCRLPLALLRTAQIQAAA